jgi:hypothetical protein
MQADPSRAISAEEVMATVRRHAEDRKSERGS